MYTANSTFTIVGLWILEKTLIASTTIYSYKQRAFCSFQLTNISCAIHTSWDKVSNGGEWDEHFSFTSKVNFSTKLWKHHCTMRTWLLFMLTLAVKGLTATMFSAPDSELIPNCAEAYHVFLFTLFLRCYEERKYPNPVMSTRVHVTRWQHNMYHSLMWFASVMTMEGKVGHSEGTSHCREFHWTTLMLAAIYIHISWVDTWACQIMHL